jgi:hypothetical protein
MPTNRFQFSDDFVLNNGNVGINTATPQAKLDVVNTIQSDNLKVTGISSFTSYEGFLNSNQNITETTTISGDKVSGSLSGEIIVGTGVTASVSEEVTSSQGSIDSLKVYNTFTVPVGGTTDRPSKATPGQLFFNRDFATMEFWDGDRWRQVDNTTQSGRGVFGGGAPAPNTAITEYINISSTGNSLDFGILTVGRFNLSAVSSSTRGLFGGGRNDNTIDYITIASQGNAIDFGDRTTTTEGLGSCSSSTRGLFAGGQQATPGAYSNVIDYITISSIGNALDFGDLTALKGYFCGGASSGVRGLFGGGETTSGVQLKTIDAVTISSTGNSVNFGSLSGAGYGVAGCSNSVRGLFGGGVSPATTNTIDYVTISSFGNASYFGDLTVARFNTSACASNIRGVWGGGRTPTAVNTIDYITIASQGNAIDFGDISVSRQSLSALSDSHGGLGGF